MNLGLRYYYGFVDIEISDTSKGIYNQSFYMTVGIPIGAGKAKEKQEKKELEQKETDQKQ